MLYLQINQTKYEIMLSYYLSGSNIVTLRVRDKCADELLGFSYLILENMSTLQNTTQSISAPVTDYTYDKYQSTLSFTASIQSASLGDQYRARIETTSNDVIWNGSFQVFLSQSADKSVYVNQIPAEGEYVSNLSANEYIILD